jgi:hypothetical protein
MNINSNDEFIKNILLDYVIETYTGILIETSGHNIYFMLENFERLDSEFGVKIVNNNGNNIDINNLIGNGLVLMEKNKEYIDAQNSNSEKHMAISIETTKNNFTVDIYNKFTDYYLRDYIVRIQCLGNWDFFLFFVLLTAFMSLRSKTCSRL